MQNRVTGFFQRLSADRRGNILLVGAASLIPLLGILGGALDAGRTYLVRTRLQQACDAAVLAGRATMGNQAWSATAKQAADRYFIANFVPGQYGSSGSQIAYEPVGTSAVRGNASVMVPMTIMRMFGFKLLNMQATCDAKLELPNADIMFVLDTTLSMAEKNPGDAISRIAALRSSIVMFYNALEHSKGSDSRVRYGFVPYSSTVNVGTLLKPDWLVSQWTYQSRTPREVEKIATKADEFQIVDDGPWVHVSGTTETSQETKPAEQCAATTDLNYKESEEDRVTNSDGTASWTLVHLVNNIERTATLSNGVCTVKTVRFINYLKKLKKKKIKNPNPDQITYTDRYWWDYGPIPYSVDALKQTDAYGNVKGGQFVANVANNHQSRTISWNQSNACIEERLTAPDADPANPLPRYDVDVDSVPRAGDASTQWRPSLPGLIYSRKQWNFNEIKDDRWGDPVKTLHTYDNYITPSDDPALRSACPTYARKLAQIDASTLNDYVAQLKPAGLTYHDVGFLWGLRLLSAQGLFASENQAPANGKLARHLIFMTDGQTETNIADYDAYGLSALDRRRTPPARLPTAGEQNVIVERRLSALCTVAKAKGVTVWVIAFGTTLTPLLSDCATPDHAFEAKDAGQLQSAFADIAKRIAQLRLVR